MSCTLKGNIYGKTGWLDAADFGEQDYALLAGREVMAYQSLYLAVPWAACSPAVV